MPKMRKNGFFRMLKIEKSLRIQGRNGFQCYQLVDALLTGHRYISLPEKSKEAFFQAESNVVYSAFWWRFLNGRNPCAAVGDCIVFFANGVVWSCDSSASVMERFRLGQSRGSVFWLSHPESSTGEWLAYDDESGKCALLNPSLEFIESFTLSPLDSPGTYRYLAAARKTVDGLLLAVAVFPFLSCQKSAFVKVLIYRKCQKGILNVSLAIDFHFFSHRKDRLLVRDIVTLRCNF